MTRNLFYTALGLMGLVWTLAIGVANADTTIIHYTGSNIEYRLNDNTEHFTGVGTITITDGIDTITILDRNLGATDAGTGWNNLNWQNVCAEGNKVYGYHFQWGNNYGFNPCIALNTSSEKIVSSSIIYNPVNQQYYSNNIFIEGYLFWLNENVTDLWGGNLTESNTLLSVDDASRRKGPCPNNFHVPSFGEILKLSNMLGDNVNNINNYLLIPFAAGRHFMGGSLDNLGLYSAIWSSTPYGDDLAMRLYINPSGNIQKSQLPRSYASSVRCFYNKYEKYPQSFNIVFLNDGKNIWNGEVVSGDKIPEEIINTYLTGLTKTGYNFSGWVISGSDEMFDVENDVVTTGMTLNAVWELNKYIITYELDGGVNNENNVTGYTIEDAVTFESPTRDGYKFDGWFTDTGFTTQVTKIAQGTTGNITLYAKWTENKKSSGSYSGGGGRSGRTSDKDKDTTNNPSVTDVTAPLESGAQGDSNDGSPLSRGDTASAERGSTQNYSQEFQEAYEFAHEKGITTMPTINDANMNGKLTRIAMAKMLSYYAINVLGQKPDETRNNKFNDITDKLDAQYDSGVTLAYQLGIMGINMPDNMFRPNDEVTRAEFATALSRMLYSTPDGKPYYATHLQKLKAEGILKNDDYKMKELRGYVMIMLKRSAK